MTTRRKALSTTTLASALLGAAALATIALGQATTAQAGPVADPGDEFEKCFVPLKAGLNDCQTASGSCAGTAGEDQLDAWIYVPGGTCERIIGASLEARM